MREAAASVPRACTAGGSRESLRPAGSSPALLAEVAAIPGHLVAADTMRQLAAGSWGAAERVQAPLGALRLPSQTRRAALVWPCHAMQQQQPGE